MKLLLISVWAALAAETALASAMPSVDAIPEPSSVVMIILGACAIGIGLVGRMRRRPQ